MSSKPRNKWISYGLRFFIYFLIFIVASIALVDMPSGQLGLWEQLGIRLVQLVFIALPICSFAFCLYGLFRLDNSKESGSAEAIGIIILLGVFGVYVAHNYLT